MPKTDKPLHYQSLFENNAWGDYDLLGILGSSQRRNAPVERDCISTRPGPVKWQTSPSPPRIVDFQLQPGRYTLTLSRTQAATVRLLVVRR